MPDTGSNNSFAEQRRRTGLIVRRLLKRYSTEAVTEPLPIETLVATILSQNTSDVNSHRAYMQLREAYPTWDEIADAEPEDIARVIRAGGLAGQKSRTIVAALRTIRERHGDFDLLHFQELDNDDLLRELTEVKGIGLKTAACVLMFSLGRDICAVDTHIHRVVNRLGILQASTPDKTFHKLRPLLPKGKARAFHVATIHFGRQTCKSQRPHCFECPLYDLCHWERKKEFAEARRPGARPVSGDFLIMDGIGTRNRK